MRTSCQRLSSTRQGDGSETLAKPAKHGSCTCCKDRLQCIHDVRNQRVLFPTAVCKTVTSIVGWSGYWFDSIRAHQNSIPRNARRCAAGLLIRVSLVRPQVVEPKFQYRRRLIGLGHQTFNLGNTDSNSVGDTISLCSSIES